VSVFDWLFYLEITGLIVAGPTDGASDCTIICTTRPSMMIKGYRGCCG
jgi:hypothetical protein